MGSPKAMAVRSTARPYSRSTSIDPAVAALLDHIAEDLAREYVCLMEATADADPPKCLPSQEDEDQEAQDARSDLRPVQLREPAPREH